MAVLKQKSSVEDKKIVHWPFGLKNYLLFAIAMATIIIGFIQLANGSITAAPILLVVGFLVLLPLAIVVGNGKSKLPPPNHSA